MAVIETEKNFNAMVQKYFETIDNKFDEECGLIGENIEKKNVIHTNVVGHAHYIKTSYSGLWYE